MAAPRLEISIQTWLSSVTRSVLLDGYILCIHLIVRFLACKFCFITIYSARDHAMWSVTTMDSKKGRYVTILFIYGEGKLIIVKDIAEWLYLLNFQGALKVLEEYMQFRFLCCEKCQLLRARLGEGLEKCEEIAFLRQIRSNICWRILSGMNTSSNVHHYMPQVIDIFKVSSFFSCQFCICLSVASRLL